MASTPILDLSTVDLSAIAISADEVGRINPQTGCMRQVDHVIWYSDDHTLGLGVKHVKHDEFWVPLHIPGRPLMPGVLIIEAAAQMSSLINSLGKQRDPGAFLGFTRCDKVAFRGQVLPGDTMYLLSREVENRPRRFVTETQAIVNNKLVFEGLVTGMVL